MMPPLSHQLFRHCEPQSGEAISHKMERLPTTPEIASSWRPGTTPRNDDKFLEGDFHEYC